MTAATQLSLVSRPDGYEPCGLAEANVFLTGRHYLGPCPPMGVQLSFGQFVDGALVALQVWRKPASRRLPSDGTWWELARWCLTPAAGSYAGSRQHAALVRWLRRNRPAVTTLISYSDPSAGHSGSLYRACNWVWRPTWHRLAPPPSGNGNWGGITQQSVKDRWAFFVRPDGRRDELLQVDPDQASRFA